MRLLRCDLVYMISVYLGHVEIAWYLGDKYGNAAHDYSILICTEMISISLSKSLSLGGRKIERLALL